MPQFRRKSVVDAVQFVAADMRARARTFHRAEGALDLETGVAMVNGRPMILTRDGLAPVSDGDWIVLHADGSQEVWHPSVFAALWEQVTA